MTKLSKKILMGAVKSSLQPTAQRRQIIRLAILTFIALC
jgi:hypothetical protein